MEDIDIKQQQRKAKTHKGKLHLNEYLPKLIEEPKNCLLINTHNSSEIMRMVLNDLYLMRKEFSKKLGQKNDLKCAFEERGTVEFLSERNNTSLFAHTSDTKKREMNLILGCLFNHQILDMFEFEVTNYIPISYFAKTVAINSSMKPIIIFQGEIFETDFNYERLKKFFLDFFRLHDLDEVDLSELQRIIIISASGDKIVKIRSFQVDNEINEYNISGERLSLTEVGPSLDLKIRRIELADEDRYRTALKQPKEIKEVKKKNIEKNALGEKRGRIHMMKQNLHALALKKYKKILGRKRFNKKKDSSANEDSKVLSLKEDN